MKRTAPFVLALFLGASALRVEVKESSAASDVTDAAVDSLDTAGSENA